jgi:hypothetical protein
MATKLKPSPSRPPTRTVTTTVPFDYKKYLATEPTLQGTLGQINAAGLEQGANLASGAQQLYGRLGEMPTNLTPELLKLLGYDDPNRLAALQSAVSAGTQAGTSALARLQQDYHGAQSGDIGSLGARGIIRSSALAQHMNENLRALTLGQYDARQGALDALQGLQSSYLTGQRELAGQAGTAVSQAQERAGKLIGLGQLGPYQQTRTVTNPYLNPAAPRQTSTGVKVGSTTTFEPKPTAANYLPQPQPKPIAAPYKAPSLGFKALR